MWLYIGKDLRPKYKWLTKFGIATDYKKRYPKNSFEFHHLIKTDNAFDLETKLRQHYKSEWTHADPLDVYNTALAFLNSPFFS